MSAPAAAAPGAAAGARVLLLGRSPEVMDAVLQELAGCGIAAQGSTEPESAPHRFDAAQFDLIAFGGGLKGALADRLRRDFARTSPQVLFLHTWAPMAVREILDALAGADGKPRLDLDAYCARIGYMGPRKPTLETLKALCALHPAAIPFEAIDVLLERGVDISPAAVDAKLIGAGRGGYCYEQNGLLKRALAAMGFQVEGLLARVRWMAPPGAGAPPRSHMALRVTLDGVPWLADAGFGGYMPTAPLRMDGSEAQPTRHETYRIIPFGGPLLLQLRQDGRWLPVYELSQEAQRDADFEPANWYTATHPASHFRQNLVVARSTPEARYRLLDARLTVQRPGREAERSVLDAGGIERALSETFGLPAEPAWRPLIERAAAAVA